MRFLKWVGCWALSFVLLLVFCAIFTNGAYIVLVPILAPIVGTIIYRATTPPRVMEFDDY